MNPRPRSMVHTAQRLRLLQAVVAMTAHFGLRRQSAAATALCHAQTQRFLPARTSRCFWAIICALLFTTPLAHAATDPRHDTLLDDDWRTIATETNADQYAGFSAPAFDDHAWQTVSVPHNWDDYGGVHRLLHGNFHGSAWYRHSFTVDAAERGRRVFLYFEGVGSYATVWVNGQPAGQHAGGRTTFTLDVTDFVHYGTTNVVAVRADEPANIRDLPWVCGADSTDPGFSEGSQPLGIFRPVHLVTTGIVRVEPFGIHVWNDATASATSAVVHVETELHNYDRTPHALTVETTINNSQGKPIAKFSYDPSVLAGQTLIWEQDSPELHNIRLWSPAAPNLYTAETTVLDGRQVLDHVTTPFGIRVLHWPAPDDTNGGPFLVNGQPVFINGTCEYEHVLGGSHAFGEEQIRARVHQLEAAGFNALRDAHQPHNLRYQEYWDHDGILWWPQFSAHVWNDTPEFRANFKSLLRDWIRERRNSPSLILWGLQNESRLPADFAAECTALIREMDPTASTQRPVTTCNGGRGVDWNVPQNWTGTYGGNPTNYADDLRRMHLVGEYGAWRSLGLHTEGGFVRSGTLSEDRFAGLMELKIRLAESVRDQVCGQFHWLLASHENPGRLIGKLSTQGGDGWGDLNGLGPVNNKGLLTIWGEPTDAYYLYRANYVSAAKDPMVVIVSHTWPDRWNGPGRKDGIVIYSNCEEVELFNDYQHESLGRHRNGGRGTHFQWDGVDVRYNVLYAEGRVNGKVVATDIIALDNLPPAPHAAELRGPDTEITAGMPGYNYLYRVHCGGTNYLDSLGQSWLGDQDFVTGENYGSLSWAGRYANVSPRFGSQRETSDIITGTRDPLLFQTFRYGREQLRYRFAVPPGEYRVELYFIEPWYGRGGGDCTGWRLFDVAVNGETKLHNLDLWAEGGYDHALKKTVTATARDGWLEISFPHVAAYEAVISAIAIATTDPLAKIPVPTYIAPPPTVNTNTAVATAAPADEAYPATKATLTGGTMQPEYAILSNAKDALTWTIEAGLGGAHDLQVRYKYTGSNPLPVELKVIASDSTVVDTKTWNLAPFNRGKWKYSGPEGGLSFNAGKYTVTLTLQSPGELRVESLHLRAP